MTSRLSGAASPYLRSHADNPVAWYPWGADAFAVARSRDVPVFISIGYSTCHWCHVMARESFSDPQIAEILNQDFVAIKVDREEHPEVDAAYLAQASAFTRGLGWPLSVFATPEGAAFFAGTYFPPSARGGIPGFADVLRSVSTAWADRQGALRDTARAVQDALSATKADDSSTDPSADNIREAVAQIVAAEDVQFGGFGSGGAKFPLATVLTFLLSRAATTLAPDSADVARFAWRAMRTSALYDEVDGGFFRYATQPDWTVPHYERMLTDNAQLIDVALLLGDERTAAAIAGFLRDVLLQPSGGLGAAQDAESLIDGVPSEGGYYARTAAERALLEPPTVDAKVVTGWNGLAIGALARLSLATGDEAFAALAADIAASVVQRNRTSSGWARASVGDVVSRASATPADRSQFAWGLTSLAMATGDVAYALLAREMVDELRDDASPRVAASDPVLTSLGITPAPESGDGDEPSALAALALASIALNDLGAGQVYRVLAQNCVARVFTHALAQPLAFGSTLTAAGRLIVATKQIVVVAHDREDPLVAAARRLGGDVFVVVTPAQVRAFAAAGFTLFDGREGRAIYACDDFVCALPITDVSELG